MKYESLWKLYFIKKNISEEYDKRFNNYCSFKSHLYINPIKRESRTKDEFELFYLPINEITLLQEKVFLKSKEIMENIKHLPKIAKTWCTREIMVNEIIKTNKIEGVYSTKKDIYNSMVSKKADRFTGVVKKYEQILLGDISNISKIEDIRNLYDEIFKEDILKENSLDGKYFRAEPIYISKGMKVVHVGDRNEDEIINHLENLIEFMNRKDVSVLIKSCITHYYLEYIHPFYDGNGRFGRFILSQYLAKKLDIFTGLSLSYAIFGEKDRYTKSFQEVSNPRNYGELTFFIKNMLEIIIKGQESIIAMVKDKSLKLDYASKYIEKLDVSEIEKNILFVYTQQQIFSETLNLEDRELAKIFKMSRHKINTYLENLENLSLIEKINKKPSIHILSEDIKEIVI